MQLAITSESLINQLQKEFNEVFPFLKLEFFVEKSLKSNDYTAANIVPAGKKLKDVYRKIKNGVLGIKENMKVSELENKFKDEFGIPVQIFRKSGNLWLETTMTDSWTLFQQNKHGLEISTTRIPGSVTTDYDLNRDADH